MENKVAEFKQVLRRIYMWENIPADDIETQRRVVMLNMLFTLGVVILTPYSVISYLQGNPLLGLFDFITVLLLVGSFFYLRRKKKHAAVAYFSTTILGALLLYVTATGGVSNTGPLWTYVFPIVALFLLGAKRGSIVIAIYFIAALLILLFPGTPLLSTTYGVDFKMRYITTFVVLYCMGFFIEWVRAGTQARIAKKTKELEQALESLRKTEEERAQLQDKLVTAKKMEAVATLAGGMAHEFNNLIAIIEGNTELLWEEFRIDKEAFKKLTSIRKASHRITALTSQLLSFSRQQMLQLETLTLNDLINRTEYTLRQSISSKIELVTQLEPNPGKIKVDPSLFTQVIMDIVSNSLDAIHARGTITIKTENVTNKSFDPESKGEGPYVCLTIQDDGHGMEKETLQKIFEPFFTTKEVGKGTGLGLSFVYGTIKQHKGWIDASSVPGEGTTIKIFLPCFF